MVASFEPFDTQTSCAIAKRGSGSECSSAPVTSLGMSWTSVPPIATLSTCMPRQIARNGILFATAARDSAISNASRPSSAAWNVVFATSP